MEFRLKVQQYRDHQRKHREDQRRNRNASDEIDRPHARSDNAPARELRCDALSATQIAPSDARCVLMLTLLSRML